MKATQTLIIALLAAALAVGACAPDTGDTDGRTVTLVLHEQPAATDALARPAVAVSPLGRTLTSLVLVMPAGAAPTPDYASAIAGVAHLGLLDLGTGRITATLPRDVPLRVWEYAFNQRYTVDELRRDRPLAGPPNVSPAFVVTSTSNEIGLTLSSATLDFAPTFAASGFLDPNLWDVESSSAEYRRVLETQTSGNTVLRLSARGQDRDVREGRVRVDPANSIAPAPFTAIQATLAVSDAQTVGPAQAEARVAGLFYHTATLGQAPGSIVGDVHASAYIEGGEARYRVGRCLDVTCRGTGFQTAAGGVLGVPVPLDEPTTLSVAWNAGTATFTFAATNTTTTTSGSATVTAVQAGLPVTEATPRVDFLEVGARLFADTGGRGGIQATADDVSVNGTAFDNFESGTLGTARWLEHQAEVWRDGAGGIVLGAGLDLPQAPAAAEQSVARLRINRHRALSDLRISGRVTLLDWGYNPAAPTTTDFRVRVVVRMHFQPPADRGTTTNLVGVQVGAQQRRSTAIDGGMGAFVCTDAACTPPAVNPVVGGGGFGTVLPDTPYPFDLRYLGGGLFRGSFNGQRFDVDVSGATAFQPRFLRDIELRVQVEEATAAGDSGGARVRFDRLSVGGEPVTPGAAPRHGSPTQPAAIPDGALATDLNCCDIRASVGSGSSYLVFPVTTGANYAVSLQPTDPGATADTALTLFSDAWTTSITGCAALDNPGIDEQCAFSAGTGGSGTARLRLDNGDGTRYPLGTWAALRVTRSLALGAGAQVLNPGEQRLHSVLPTIGGAFAFVLDNTAGGVPATVALEEQYGFRLLDATVDPGAVVQMPQSFLLGSALTYVAVRNDAASGTVDYTLSGAADGDGFGQTTPIVYPAGTDYQRGQVSSLSTRWVQFTAAATGSITITLQGVPGATTTPMDLDVYPQGAGTALATCTSQPDPTFGWVTPCTVAVTGSTTYDVELDNSLGSTESNYRLYIP